MEMQYHMGSHLPVIFCTFRTPLGQYRQYLPHLLLQFPGGEEGGVKLLNLDPPHPKQLLTYLNPPLRGHIGEVTKK